MAQKYKRYKVALVGFDDDSPPKRKRRRGRLAPVATWSWQLKTACLCFVCGIAILLTTYGGLL